LLSDFGIEHLLVERHTGTSILPKAHYLNQRTMEVFRQHGVADSVYAVGTPMDKMGKVRWRTTLGGDGPLEARTFYEMDAFGGGKSYKQAMGFCGGKYAAHPCRTIHAGNDGSRRDGLYASPAGLRGMSIERGLRRISPWAAGFVSSKEASPRAAASSDENVARAFRRCALP
jgi:hypothetical protein